VCNLAVDLAFVMDSSGSINEQDGGEWSRMRNLVTQTVRRFDIGHSTAHVGVIRYSNDAEIVLYLNDSRSINSSIDRSVSYLLRQ